MATYRVVRVPASKGLPHEGWGVERTALGEHAKRVSVVYAEKSDAHSEARRLRTLEPAKVEAKTEYILARWPRSSSGG